MTQVGQYISMVVDMCVLRGTTQVGQYTRMATLAELSNISSNALAYCLLVHKVSDYIGLNMLLSWMVVVITLTQNKSRTVARTIP